MNLRLKQTTITCNAMLDFASSSSTLKRHVRLSKVECWALRASANPPVIMGYQKLCHSHTRSRCLVAARSVLRDSSFMENQNNGQLNHLRDTLLQVADLRPPCRTARITTQKVRSAEYLDRVSYCMQLAFMSYVSVPEKKKWLRQCRWKIMTEAMSVLKSRPD